MEKIILKNGESINITNGGCFGFTVSCKSLEEMIAIQKLLTEENLECITFANEESVHGTYTNKYSINTNFIIDADGIITATYALGDVDLVQKELNRLRTELATIKKEQAVQDEAIAMLGTTVSATIE